MTGTRRRALLSFFLCKPTYKVGASMTLRLWRRKLMTGRSLREETLLQAGILLHGSRLEIATGIKVKGSPWEVICMDTVRDTAGLGGYQWYFAKRNSLGRGRNILFLSCPPVTP